MSAEYCSYCASNTGCTGYPLITGSIGSPQGTMRTVLLVLRVPAVLLVLYWQSSGCCIFCLPCTGFTNCPQSIAQAVLWVLCRLSFGCFTIFHIAYQLSSGNCANCSPKTVWVVLWVHCWLSYRYCADTPWGAVPVVLRILCQLYYGYCGDCPMNNMKCSEGGQGFSFITG